MIGLLKLIGFGFLALTVVYLIIRRYALSVTREALERAYDSGQDGVDAQERDTYIDAGLLQYKRSLRFKLLWLIYILPLASIILTAYVVNSQ